VAQIYIYLYLFFSNIRTGVPRLIANLLTLLFSTIVISWLSAEVFNVHLATVLTTSAIFTIVLGIALQDTLGNLFSGVALQIERPFKLDDWVEIQSGGETWVGQVYDITWRATSMIGFNDQLIVIPNKTIAQSQLTIFSHQHKSPRLFQQFRIRFETPIDEAKLALLEGVNAVDEVLSDPPPRVFVCDVTEAWVMMRVYYSLRDYGRKIEAADQVISSVLESLHIRGIYTGTNLTRVGTWFEESVPPLVMDDALSLIKETQREGIYRRKSPSKPL
jgi:small-conductance mechanosensitive channel